MKKTRQVLNAVVAAIVALSAVHPAASRGEPLQKLPRVAELEDSLRDNGSTYLKARFPDRPFLLSVSVDPLRRSTAKATGSEDLPYFDGGGDEIQDEWDDPQVSLKQLISRTTKITVSVSLDGMLSDNEVAEVKESLMKTLHLVPARDEVQFNFRTWTSSSARWLYPTIAFALAVLFLVGFFLIQRSGTARIATALREQKVASSGPTPLAGLPMGGQTTPASARRDSGSTTVRGGVQVSDPIRARDMIAKFVEALGRRKNFPTLSAMALLEDYGARNPSGLGALLSELPLESQTRLYSLGSSDCWFGALNAPGMASMEEIELLQRLVREPESGRSPELEEMVIRVWRLGDRMPEFLRGQPRDVAMTILSYLPKNVAISAARKAFPGAWADLLDPAMRVTSLKPEKIEEISRVASEIRPLGRLEDFKRRRAEVELFDYLKIASPEEEREIYLASRTDSAIHRERPPFFAVLEADETRLREFCPRVTPDQWALALFNVDRVSRRKIQSFLGDKQSFLLLETIKQLDQSAPDRSRVGEAREAIASAFAQQFEHPSRESEAEESKTETSDESATQQAA